MQLQTFYIGMLTAFYRGHNYAVLEQRSRLGRRETTVMWRHIENATEKEDR